MDLALESLGLELNAIPALAGSPLLKNLSIAILVLSESGQLTYLHEKWWASSCGPRIQTSRTLQPQDLLGLFLLLGVGLSVGLLLALMELLSRARNQTRDGKVGKSRFASVLLKEPPCRQAEPPRCFYYLELWSNGAGCLFFKWRVMVFPALDLWLQKHHLPPSVQMFTDLFRPLCLIEVVFTSLHLIHFSGFSSCFSPLNLLFGDLQGTLKCVIIIFYFH